MSQWDKHQTICNHYNCHDWVTWNILSHWGRDKMAAIFQTTFSNGWQCMNCDWIFIEVCSRGSVMCGIFMESIMCTCMLCYHIPVGEPKSVYMPSHGTLRILMKFNRTLYLGDQLMHLLKQTIALNILFEENKCIRSFYHSATLE